MSDTESGVQPEVPVQEEVIEEEPVDDEEKATGGFYFMAKRLSCCVGITIVFYLFLAILISFSRSKEVNADLSNTGKDTSTGPRSGLCSANSFLLGDRVCDEVTNNERCLYDGGDCCLSNKNTKYCQDCTCRKNSDSSIIWLFL